MPRTVPSPARGSTATSPRAWAAPSSAARWAGTEPVPRSADASPHTHPRRLAATAAIAVATASLARPCGASTRTARAAPAASGLAQAVSAAGVADGHDRHLVPALLGEAQGDLQRGPVGIGDARPPLVAVDGDPLPADDDHERRNTTPWPPSGYDQEIAPSLLHTR